MLDGSPHSDSPAQRLALVETLFIFLVFFLHGAWPVPDVNEPHYLGKAKHYWDPSWCAGDSFLESRDAHQVFYWSCGWLTRVMPLAAAAWVGRVATWLLLAIAWRRLSWQVVPRPLWSIVTGGVFVTLMARGHLAGEWVVGGFESKGFSYALVLFALEVMLRRRWVVAWPLLGAASAMHVLVGGWSTLAALVARAALWREGPPARAEIAAFVLAAGLAALGVVPALLLNQGAQYATVAEAARIYVFERLGHHLVLYKMRPEFIARFALLVLAWLFVDRQASDDRRLYPLRILAGPSLVLAVVGGVVSAYALVTGDESVAAILRFYWFRLADVAIPLALTLGGAVLLARWWTARPSFAGWVAIGALAACVLHFADVTLARMDDRRPLADGPRKVVDYAAWRSACEWIDRNERIPRHARFLTPRMAHTFKWYAGRAEVTNWKDVPQDADGIVRWWQTLRDVHGKESDPDERWYDSLAERDVGELRRLAQKYGATHLITEADPPLALPVLLKTNEYAIYELKPK
jgi:hypothetical protein